MPSCDLRANSVCRVQGQHQIGQHGYVEFIQPLGGDLPAQRLQSHRRFHVTKALTDRVAKARRKVMAMREEVSQRLMTRDVHCLMRSGSGVVYSSWRRMMR